MNNKNNKKYISIRIAQLKEDRDKANTNYDAAWYNRLIQELDWADQMIHNKEKRNCSLDDFELIESTFPCDTEQQ